MATKICRTCSLEKPTDQFSLKASSKDGYKPTCKICDSAYNAAKYLKDQERRAEYREGRREYARAYAAQYNAANRESIALRQAAYAAAHPEVQKAKWMRRRRTMKAAPGTITAEDLRDLLRLQRGKCPVCRGSIKSKYHADHIVPLSKGGTNYRTNIQLLCPPCNLRKHAKDPIAFAQENGMLL